MFAGQNDPTMPPNLVPVAANTAASASSHDLLVFDDSASSEGVPTPGEGPREPGTPLSIDIPNKSFKPLIGTPFLTASNSLFEYPFPAVPSPSRPPLSNTSSSSSISSLHGPPSPAAIDKHIPHLFARFTTRSHTHRRSSSAGGMPSIPIPPRLRKFSGSHTRDVKPGASVQRVPTSIGIDTRSSGEQGQFTLSNSVTFPNERSKNIPGSRRSWVMSARELGPALSSTPRTCIDVHDKPRHKRRNPSPLPADSDDERALRVNLGVNRGGSSHNIAHLGLKNGF